MGDNKMTNGMATSRRNFIKGAGITLAGATALSIMGCASGNSSSASSSSQKWDGEYDVIVVGAGIAGVTAAITVADEGNGASASSSKKMSHLTEIARFVLAGKCTSKKKRGR